MTDEDGRRVDVLVVGGGPTGMTVAGDLARSGRSVAVLERWPQINPAGRSVDPGWVAALRRWTRPA